VTTMMMGVDVSGGVGVTVGVGVGEGVSVGPGVGDVVGVAVTTTIGGIGVPVGMSIGVEVVVPFVATLIVGVEVTGGVGELRKLLYAKYPATPSASKAAATAPTLIARARRLNEASFSRFEHASLSNALTFWKSSL
jgi:hypothetical protein